MSDADPPPHDSRPFIARSFAGLFGMGGLVVVLMLPLPHPHDRVLALTLAPAAVAIVVATALLIVGARLPLRLFYLLPPFGSLLVALVSIGAGNGNRVVYCAFFFWAIAAAFYFLPRSAAIPNVPLAAGLYAVVIWTSPEPFGAVRYLVPTAGLVVSAVLIDRLNVERERLQHNLKEMIVSLDAQARSDGLTGLSNRRELELQLEQELSRAGREGHPVSVLMIDMDRFKLLNDSQGHAAGDQLLRAVARIWPQQLREGDLLARYGGDEFAAVLPDCRLDHAWELAERLRAAVPGNSCCSVGAATWLPRESAEALLRRADQALMRVKRDGRNQIALTGQSELIAPLRT